jgi:hypothetical protein
MNTLPKDIVRILAFNYVDGEYVINFLKICSKVYNSFNANERKILRQKYLYFVERVKQTRYIRNVIDDMTVKEIKANERRGEDYGRNRKKHTYDFCEGCANVIRSGRRERHSRACRNNFHNCKWCGIPYASQSSRGVLSTHLILYHNESKCPRRNE